MPRKTVVAMVVSVAIMSVVFFFGWQYLKPAELATEEPKPAVGQIEPIEPTAPANDTEIKIEGTPITLLPEKPQVIVTEDDKGNQEITPVQPKPVEPAPPETEILPKTLTPPEPEVKPEPKPEVKPEPKPEPKPIEKPKPTEPKPEVKPEVKPEPKPQEPATPEFGAVRVVDGQEQMYVGDLAGTADGWVTPISGGESEYWDVVPSGEIIGH